MLVLLKLMIPGGMTKYLVFTMAIANTFTYYLKLKLLYKDILHNLCRSAVLPHKVRTVCVFQITYKILSFTLEDS